MPFVLIISDGFFALSLPNRFAVFGPGCVCCSSHESIRSCSIFFSRRILYQMSKFHGFSSISSVFVAGDTGYRRQLLLQVLHEPGTAEQVVFLPLLQNRRENGRLLTQIWRMLIFCTQSSHEMIALVSFFLVFVWCRLGCTYSSTFVCGRRRRVYTCSVVAVY